MSFPNYPQKLAGQAVLTAADTIAYRRRLGRLPDLDGLAGALLCLERGLPRRMRWRIPIREAGSMNGDLYALKKAHSPTAIVANFGAGAPIVVSLAEELIALGARRLLLMTGGGALQTGLKAGDVIVCEKAIRDEGASHHYLPPEKYIAGDTPLAERLVQAIRSRGRNCRPGSSWTTDAGFRETRQEVQQYQSEGVDTVEMEIAGLFAVARVRGVAASAAVVVMDSLATLEWQVPEKRDAIQASLDAVYAAAVEVLSSG